jgi:hypothetical protein
MKPRTNIYLAFIFLTGATTLSLELLASRIMTPYFGVSLYIWTGILSITLIALSLGYYIGGRLTGNDAAKDTGRIEYLFLLMPALSALAIALSCWLYPGTFADIASFSLVLGSFFACILLIFFPLIAVSAMNPLLIAMENAAGTRATTGHCNKNILHCSAIRKSSKSRATGVRRVRTAKRITSTCF